MIVLDALNNDILRDLEDEPQKKSQHQEEMNLIRAAITSSKNLNNLKENFKLLDESLLFYKFFTLLNGIEFNELELFVFDELKTKAIQDGLNSILKIVTSSRENPDIELNSTNQL